MASSKATLAAAALAGAAAGALLILLTKKDDRGAGEAAPPPKSHSSASPPGKACTADRGAAESEARTHSPAQLIAGFAAAFGDAAGDLRVASAPGRANLIGEHTDYAEVRNKK